MDRIRALGGARWRAGAVVALMLAGLAAVVALGVTAESARTLAAPGGGATFAGRLAGLLAAYGMLVTVLLVARLPWLERALGQDRLVRWHRRLAPWPLVLLAAHGVLIVAGYAALARTGMLAELRTLVVTYPGVLAATAGAALLGLAAVTSYRAARRRMAYETWWAVHLYTYLGLGLSFAHQTSTGASFVGRPVAGALWTAAWLGAAALVLWHRLVRPALRSLRHGLRVEAVVQDAPGVSTVVLRGRDLDELAPRGGQHFQWRFLVRGMWWQSHPYSLSGAPSASRMQITVKALGDHSRWLRRVRPGTRVAIEGPYGTFVAPGEASPPIALIGAGVGVAPLVAVAEELPRTADVVAVARASREEDLVLRADLRRAVSARGGRVHEILGPRRTTDVGRALRDLVPDLAEREVYICGPDGFAKLVADVAARAGTPRSRVHREEFAF